METMQPRDYDFRGASSVKSPHEYLQGERDSVFVAPQKLPHEYLQGGPELPAPAPPGLYADPSMVQGALLYRGGSVDSHHGGSEDRVESRTARPEGGVHPYRVEAHQGWGNDGPSYRVETQQGRAVMPGDELGPAGSSGLLSRRKLGVLSPLRVGQRPSGQGNSPPSGIQIPAGTIISPGVELLPGSCPAGSQAERSPDKMLPSAPLSAPPASRNPWAGASGRAPGYTQGGSSPFLVGSPPGLPRSPGSSPKRGAKRTVPVPPSPLSGHASPLNGSTGSPQHSHLATIRAALDMAGIDSAALLAAQHKAASMLAAEQQQQQHLYSSSSTSLSATLASGNGGMGGARQYLKGQPESLSPRGQHGQGPRSHEMPLVSPRSALLLSKSTSSAASLISASQPQRWEEEEEKEKQQQVPPIPQQQQQQLLQLQQQQQQLKQQIEQLQQLTQLEQGNGAARELAGQLALVAQAMDKDLRRCADDTQLGRPSNSPARPSTGSPGIGPRPSTGNPRERSAGVPHFSTSLNSTLQAGRGSTSGVPEGYHTQPSQGYEPSGSSQSYHFHAHSMAPVNRQHFPSCEGPDIAGSAKADGGGGAPRVCQIGQEGGDGPQEVVKKWLEMQEGVSLANYKARRDPRSVRGQRGLGGGAGGRAAAATAAAGGGGGGPEEVVPGAYPVQALRVGHHKRMGSADIVLQRPFEPGSPSIGSPVHSASPGSKLGSNLSRQNGDVNFLAGYNLNQISSQDLVNLLVQQKQRKGGAGGGAGGPGGAAPGHTDRDGAGGSGGGRSRALDGGGGLVGNIGKLRPSSHSVSYQQGQKMAAVASQAAQALARKSTRENRVAGSFDAGDVVSGTAIHSLRDLKPIDYVLRKPYEDVKDFFVLHKSELGSGQFGIIRPCMELATGSVYACKTIQKKCIKSMDDAEDIRKEVACLSLLRNHPTIVTLKSTFEDKESIHIIMELCKGGDLFDRVTAKGRLAEEDAATLCRSLVEALLHCHCLGIVHRDVKPENILLVDKKSDFKMKLVDFGVATFYESGKPITEVLGTPEYMAPEVLMQAYGPEADIWSAGVVLYIILCGVPPFWASSRRSVAESILRNDVSFKSTKWSGVSEECKDLVRRMLTKNPAQRISATEILSHPWVQKMAK